jgi:hypothetical protein
MEHSLFSQNEDMTIAFFAKYDRIAIKEAIVEHLKQNPTDVLEHCKSYNKTDIRRFYGNKILNFYSVNPKNQKVSLNITKGDKIYFKKIED